MKPLPPPPPGGRSAGGLPGRATLVGGLPWAVPPGAVPGMPVVTDAPVSRLDGAGEPPGPQTWPERIRELAERSPPLTISLAVHVVVLLVLALWFVRVKQPDILRIDLSFASTEIVEEKDPGVPIVAPPDPVKEPEPEPVKSEKPPVEDPVAAPPMAEVEDAPGPGAVEAVAAAPAIGSLLDGREEGRRQALVNAFGGNGDTEAAVARALEWLAKQQNKKDGLWSLQGPYVDGGSQENRLAATAMALLAFQGAGNTPTSGRHKAVVARAWKGLVAKQLADGRFEFTPPIPHHQSLYSHAQATIAACELYGMTKAAAFAEPAKKAVAYAVKAQAENGGWRYEPGEQGDMSVTGWYMMAMKSAQMAGLDVPPQTMARIEAFVEDVSLEDGTKYGYRRDSPERPPVQVTAAVTAEGLLCRQYLGWAQDDRRIRQGLELLLGSKVVDWENDKDVYAWYYVTQVAHHAGGDAWYRWNDRMKDVLPKVQVRGGGETGSWDPALDKWGHIGGRLFVTCFCTYMLEVYYRHLPLYGDAALATAAQPPAAPPKE